MVFARESLVLGAAVMVPVLAYVFRRERFGKFWSISLHASAHRDTTIVFGTGLFMMAVFLAIYFQEWFVPKYGYGSLRQVMLWAMVMCFALLAIIPHYDGKWQGRAHVHISWAMVVLMPVMLLLHGVHAWGSRGSIVAFSGVFLQGVLLAVFYGVKGMYERFALMQSLFIAAYFLCVGILGYM